MSITVFYDIPVPFTLGLRIQVYGESDMGAYEWRVVSVSGHITKDTVSQMYGCPEIALRDALVEMS